MDADAQNEYGDTIDSVLKHMVEIIADKFNPQSIILFGSHARGDVNKHSDIDLLVIVNEDMKQTEELAIEIGAALHASPIPKDIMVTTPSRFAKYSKSTGTLYENILEEGVKIYG